MRVIQDSDLGYRFTTTRVSANLFSGNSTRLALTSILTEDMSASDSQNRAFILNLSLNAKRAEGNILRDASHDRQDFVPLRWLLLI